MPKVKKLLTATQEGAVRIDEKTPPEMEGLCTDNLKVCIGLVIQGKEKNNSRRISLSHIDAKVELNSLEKEIDFVLEYSSIEKIIFAYNPSKDYEKDATELLKKIKKILIYYILQKKNEFAIHQIFNEFKTLKGTFFIDRSSAVCGEIPDKGVQLMKAIDINFRHTINMLNHSIDKDISHRGLDLQYDGKKFTDLPILAPGIQYFINEVVENKKREKNFGRNSIIINYSTETVDQAIKEGSIKPEDKSGKIKILTEHLALYIGKYFSEKLSSSMNITPKQAPQLAQSMMSSLNPALTNQPKIPPQTKGDMEQEINEEDGNIVAYYLALNPRQKLT